MPTIVDPPITPEELSELAPEFRERLLQLRSARATPRGPGRPIFGGRTAAAPKTPGEAFVESDAYQSWLDQYPAGAPGMAMSAQSAPVSARTAVGASRMRSLVTSADASAGTLVPADQKGLLEPGLVRPLSVLQLVTRIPTDSDAPDYVAEDGRVAAAAPVTEAVQLAHTGDVTATKPEGGLAFERREVLIKTFAVWVPATKRIVADAPRLREYIDGYLTNDLDTELEDQVVTGTGGAGFTGLLNTSGTQSVGPPGAGESVLHVLRRARRMVIVGARTIPTGVLMNPVDAENVDLLEVNGEDNNFLGDPFGTPGQRTLWGMARIETEAVPAGTALVGDFRRAIVFDREAVDISVGTVGDDFIRNIVRILAELRAGFAVARPSAFVEVDLAA